MKKLVPAFLFLSVLIANGALRYVDNAATGSNNGSSWANAWTSIDNISGVAGGDTVFISGGTTSKTYNLFCFFPPSGATNNPITYRVGQDPGHNGLVIFHPAASHDNQAIYLSSGQGWGNWVVIDGEYQGQRHLQIDSGWGSAIQVGGVSTGFTLRYATLNAQIRMDDSRKTEIAYCYWNPTSGIDRCIVNAGRGDSTFGDNKFHHNTFNLYYQRGANAVGGNGDDGIANTGGADIYNNRFIGVLVASFNGNQHGDSIQTDGSAIRIFNNYFENAGSNYGIYAEFGSGGGSNWQIFNNVFNVSDATLRSQPSQSIAIGAHGPGTWTNWYIFNNTFLGGGQSIAFGDSSASNSFPGSFLKNNLTMTGSGPINVWNGTVPNNSNNVTGVPASYFVNAAGGDFHLTSAATTAIGDGSSAGLTGITTTDADGNARGSTWDVGAFQFGTAVADTTPPTISSATVNNAGNQVTLNFSEGVNFGAGGSGGFTLSMSGGTSVMSSPSGTGSNSITFNLSRVIQAVESGNLSYIQPGNGWQDLAPAPNALATVAGISVSNSSIQGPPALNSATINPAGTQIALVFSQVVQAGSGGSAGWTLNVTPAATLGTMTGTGTNTLTYNINRVINAGESITLSYAQPGNGIEAVASGADVASITNRAVTNNSTQGATATPVITLAAGPYFGTQTTTITSPDTGAGAVIRYTFDGTTPSASSIAYSGPISIQNNQTIQAISIWSGHPNSAIASSTYEVVSWNSLGTAWKTFAVPQKTGTFTWSFSVTAPAAGSDAVVGLGPSAVSAYTGMACIVQFNANTINAINGGGYTTGPAYTPSANYNFAATINLTAHTWSCTVTPAAGGATSTLVTNAAFRTEQAAATQLSWVGIQANSGTIQVSNMAFPSGPSSARYIGLRGVPAAGGAVP